MGAKDIIEKKFETVLRGYKSDEVDEYLGEVSIEYSKLLKVKEELEQKLGVLADKIREYRKDEDTLKDALLGAQRQGNALIADSKRKAAEIVEEAQSKSDEILKKAGEDKQKLSEEGAKEIKAAEEKARAIIDTANKKARDIEQEMNLRTNVQKEILHRTTTEITDFKSRVLKSYKEHMATIEKVVADCENEFIKNTLKEGKPNFKTLDPSQENAKTRRINKTRAAMSDNSGDTGAIGVAEASEAADFSDSSNSLNSAENQDGKAQAVSQNTQSESNDSKASKPAQNLQNTQNEENIIKKFEINVDNDYSPSEDNNDTGEYPLFKSKTNARKQPEDIFAKGQSSRRPKQPMQFGRNNNES